MQYIVMLTFDEQLVSFFVLVHIRIWMCCCLVTMIAITHPSSICIHANTLQWRQFNDILTLDVQNVRLFVLVHIQIWMCCCLVMMIAIAHPCANIYATTLQCAFVYKPAYHYT